jgi:hypothetical protein
MVLLDTAVEHQARSAKGTKDRTIEAVLSSGWLKGFRGNGKYRVRPRVRALFSNSLSLEAGVPARGHTHFFHGLLVCLHWSHPAARMLWSHPAPTHSLYSTPRPWWRGGRCDSSSSGRSSSSGCTASGRGWSLASMANSLLLCRCWVHGISVPLAGMPRRWSYMSVQHVANMYTTAAPVVDRSSDAF